MDAISISKETQHEDHHETPSIKVVDHQNGDITDRLFKKRSFAS